VSPLDAAFRGDGGQLLTASFEEGMQAWDVARRAEAGPSIPLARDPELDGAVAFSQDGRLLATSPVLDDALVWDTQRRRPLDGPIEGTGASTLAFSPDGRTLAWADSGGDVTIWDVADEPPAEPWVEGNNDWANPAFSPDGRWLAVDSSGGVELWDVQARRPVTTLARHSDAVFSPDSRFLAASAGTSEVAIWRVADLARIATLDAGVPSDALRFSPDSQLLATSGDGVTLQRFDAPWAARHLCAILGRDLTRQEWDDRVRGRAYQPACS
jgi:WD40 repeat protein